MKIARSQWTEHYGERAVHDMAPFQAYRRGRHWVVVGQGLELPLGAGLVAIIDADSGQVIRLAPGLARDAERP